MAISYTTLGSTVTINPTGAVVASQLNTSIAVVGGYDSNNADASVTAGEASVVNSTTEAANLFGADSELAYQTRVALRNGADEVYGVPLPETTTTESFTSTSSGTLGNAPAMNPELHPDESISAQDANANSVAVNIVYDTPSTPSGPNEINLNPITGNWEADSSGDYDITYTYGDFSTAITEAVSKPVRYVAVDTENGSVKSTLVGQLQSAATNFRFLRGVVGSEGYIDPASTASYTPDEEDWRMVEVAPSYGTSQDGKTRTAGAIAGLLAQQPIDVTGSITYDDVEAFDSLHTNYTPSEASNFTQVTAITDIFEVAEGVTTSAETTFRDIYAVEIIDFIVEQLYVRVKNYRGGSNAASAKRMFQSRLSRALGSFSAPSAQPPLLATGDGARPYAVSVTEGATKNEADVNAAIEVAPIAKQVNLDISVGPIEFNGATV